MVPDIFYRGYRIVSDAKEEPAGGFWRAKAAVVEPADASGVERVHPIGTIGWFRTEQEAIDFFVAEAKKWVDERCGS